MSTTSTQSGYSFDAGDLFPPFSVASAPPGEIILHVPEGISSVSLRKSDIGKQLIRQDSTWYDTYPWATEALPSGVYHLRLPVPNCNRKTFDEQKTLLLDGEEVAPLVLVELAMLCLKKAGHSDPHDGWVRCKEATANGFCVALTWHDGRLYVGNYWSDRRRGDVWFATARVAS